MRDRKWIIGGLVVFCAVVLFPVWYGFGTRATAAPPDLVLPANDTACVEPTEWMIANHPELLNEWRYEVIRKGRTDYVSSTGATYTMSFTGTCLRCHTSRATFCQRCHDYADVQPTCWNCHVESQGK
ncbi:MAG: sulfate reduction electron transfer complex DsrMKJOP subunit DsrJ [Gemmatimonadota bacterium]